MENRQKALFANLDGTIITTNSGRKFPIHSADWKFIPETLDALKYYYKKGYKIIIVTNQGGIEEGYMAEKVFIEKIGKICELLEKKLKFTPNSICYFYCPNMVDYNRKPNPGMAYEAAIDYELNLLDSIMLGNTDRDSKFTANAGIGTYIDVADLLLMNWVM